MLTPFLVLMALLVLNGAACVGLVLWAFAAPLWAFYAAGAGLVAAYVVVLYYLLEGGDRRRITT